MALPQVENATQTDRFCTNIVLPGHGALKGGSRATADVPLFSIYLLFIHDHFPSQLMLCAGPSSSPSQQSFFLRGNSNTAHNYRAVDMCIRLCVSYTQRYVLVARLLFLTSTRCYLAPSTQPMTHTTKMVYSPVRVSCILRSNTDSWPCHGPRSEEQIQPKHLATQSATAVVVLQVTANKVGWWQQRHLPCSLMCCCYVNPVGATSDLRFMAQSSQRKNTTLSEQERPWGWLYRVSTINRQAWMCYP